VEWGRNWKVREGRREGVSSFAKATMCSVLQRKGGWMVENTKEL